MHRLGHWALCAGLPVIVVLYAPFEPLALVMLLLTLYLHYLCLFSHFLLLLPFLQGRCAFASKAAHLRDPEPHQQQRVTRELSRNLENGWLALKSLFASPLMSCQLPFTWSFLLQQSFPYFALESACYGIIGHTICMDFQVLVIQNW